MKRIRFVYVAFAALVTVLAVPAAGVSKGSDVPTSVGAGEGKLTLVAWEGYTEKQWVAPFEKATGCKVSAKYAGSSNDMFNLMTSGGGGQYDMVSASGDASLRLIYSGAVAEVNVGLIPSYKDFFKAFQSPSTNTVDGKHYGVSLQFGPNLLLYNTAKEKKPTSWAAIYDPKNKGKITIPDNPIQIADAALYLSKTKPSLGITDPYELTKAQLAAAVALLKQQRPLVKKYWGLASDQIDLFKNGGSTLGASWPYQYSQLLAAKAKVGDGDPEGGRHGLARHLDAVVQGQASELRLQVDAVHLDAKAAGPAGDLLRGDAGQQEGVPDHEHARQGLVRAALGQRPGELLPVDQVLEDADRRLRQRQEGLHRPEGVDDRLDTDQGVGTSRVHGRCSCDGGLPPRGSPPLSLPFLLAPARAEDVRADLGPRRRVPVRLRRRARRAPDPGVLDDRLVHGEGRPLVESRQLPRDRERARIRRSSSGLWRSPRR